jgi:hypothetical protein
VNKVDEGFVGQSGLHKMRKNDWRLVLEFCCQVLSNLSVKVPEQSVFVLLLDPIHKKPLEQLVPQW